jgi:hypothetical protein
MRFAISEVPGCSYTACYCLLCSQFSFCTKGIFLKMGSDKRFDFREQPKGFLELLLKLSGRRGRSPTPSETSLESEPFSDQLEQFISPSRQESHESEISKVVMKNHEYRGRIDSQRDYWMRDDNVKECYDCKIPFSTFKRR